jgi:hypothetical protein
MPTQDQSVTLPVPDEDLFDIVAMLKRSLRRNLERGVTAENLRNTFPAIVQAPPELFDARICMWALPQEPTQAVSPEPVVVNGRRQNKSHVLCNPWEVLPELRRYLQEHPLEFTDDELWEHKTQIGHYDTKPGSTHSFSSHLMIWRQTYTIRENGKWRLPTRDEVCTIVTAIRCMQRIKVGTGVEVRSQPEFHFSEVPVTEKGFQLKEYNVKAMLNDLTRHGLLLAESVSDKDKRYRLNPEFGWDRFDALLNAYTSRNPNPESQAKAGRELQNLMRKHYWERCRFVYEGVEDFDIGPRDDPSQA